MNTHDKYELPPLPDTDWYAVWHGRALFGIYSTLTEATDVAGGLKGAGTVSAIYLEQQLRRAQISAIEHARQRRDEPVAWRIRHRSEPGMIGHYPWSYTDRIRGGHDDTHYEYEPLFAAPQPAEQMNVPGESHEAVGSFIWDGDEWRMVAAEHREDPDVVILYRPSVQPAASAPDNDAPPCWWINHGSHGQITQRPDEADSAVAEGKTVVEYARRFCQPVASAEPVCETGMPRHRMHKWFKSVPAGTLLYTAPVTAQPSVQRKDHE